MKYGISISIDVTKILKERLYQGKKGTYLDLTMFIDPENPDQYGNHGFISQSQTKEERESGAEKPPILGNGKVFYTGESENKAQQYKEGIAQSKQIASPTTPDFQEDMDVPF